MTNNRFYIIFIIFIGLLPYKVKSQQQAVASHYMFDPYSINPGAAGYLDKVNVNMIGRQQWQGFNGAPSVAFFSVNAPLNIFKSQKIQHAFGFSAINDQAGFDLITGIQLGYTMRFNVGNGKLGVGFQGGIDSYGLSFQNGESFTTSSENNFHDPSIPEAYEGEIGLDFDVGAFYKTDDMFFGLSSAMVNDPDIEVTGQSATYTLPKVRHYYFTTGYNLYLPNPSFEVRPSFLIGTDATSLSFDISALFVYNKKIWGGLSYGIVDASSISMVFFGLELIENLNVGFAYAIPSGNFMGFTDGTFELMLNYNFTLTKEKITKQYKSIRYL